MRVQPPKEVITYEVIPTSSSFRVAHKASFMPTCMFEMCGTDIPGVSNRYIKGWSHTRIRSEVDLVHPGLAPTGAGLPPTFRWSDLNLLMRLLLPTLGIPTTNRLLSGCSARCHLSSAPTSLETVGIMAAVCGQ